MRHAKIAPTECVGIIAFGPSSYEMKDVPYIERKYYEKMRRVNVKTEEKENPFSLQFLYRLFSKKT